MILQGLCKNRSGKWNIPQTEMGKTGALPPRRVNPPRKSHRPPFFPLKKGILGFVSCLPQMIYNTVSKCERSSRALGTKSLSVFSKVKYYRNFFTNLYQQAPPVFILSPSAGSEEKHEANFYKKDDMCWSASLLLTNQFKVPPSLQDQKELQT